MKRALGDDIEGEQGENFLRSDNGPSNNYGEEEKSSGNGDGGYKNYFKKALSKITKSENSEDYESLPESNNDPSSNQYQSAGIQAHEISYGQNENDYESPVFPVDD